MKPLPTSTTKRDFQGQEAIQNVFHEKIKKRKKKTWSKREVTIGPWKIDYGVICL